jgi:Tfp pilus assembly protein PilP
MRISTALLAGSLALGTAFGQSPAVIGQVQQKLSGVQQQQTAASNAAVAATQGQSGGSASAKPAPSAVKPAGTTTPNSNNKGVTIVPMTSPKETGKAKSVPAKSTAPASKPVDSAASTTDASKKDASKTISMVGRRDPFISPVVAHINGGSGCSNGKRCLAVDQIALTGIVKSDGGMIAIVVNALNKAYFLRENDPVFNGYVVRITGDSIVFKETIQDDLGKPLTREITKKITNPAV